MFFEADRSTGEATPVGEEPAPEHQPGLVPRWLADRKVEVVMAGGMGPRAAELLRRMGIEPVVCEPHPDPAEAVRKWLDGTLRTGEASCEKHGS